jgi:hypothetical protein
MSAGRSFADRLTTARVAIALVIVLATLFLFPWDMVRYRRSRLMGANETRVRQLLGNPDFDSRESSHQGGGDSDQSFILSYYGQWGRFYMIHLSNGSVDGAEQRWK